MDFLKQAASDFQNDNNNNSNNSNNNNDNNINNNSNNNQSQQLDSGKQNQNEGGFLSSIGNKLNTVAGGGPQGENNEDFLDKGVDLVQEKVLGQGQQSNESAIEQAKDEQISDFIRSKYKGATGSDFPVADK